ncbi:hypothetical protein LAUMK4_02992 [Mycobacterium persicum]|uniref:Uncharacterized protein n=1 Tax=Mycobacterium persicum TaxID=1487726 RepID=A0ABY6RJU0_9MYCO|nr:hypothetical protein LAUMK15_03318 [Mycobacterium persicum]VAZ94972.1 hypothetical protein LAUMK4_02992 [Mycobacterium persicum]
MGDITQPPATTRRSDTLTATAFFLGDAFLHSTPARAETPDLANPKRQDPNIKDVLPQPQPRPIPTPIVEMQQALPGLRRTVGIHQGINRKRTHRRHIQPLPSSRRTLGIGQKMPRAELIHTMHRRERRLVDTLRDVAEEIENRRQRIANLGAQKMRQLTAHIALHPAHQTISDPHSTLHRPLLGLRFTTQVVQHRLDVLSDLFDLLQRIAVKDRHHLVPQP